MSEDLKGKTGTVKVMYVRREENEVSNKLKSKKGAAKQQKLTKSSCNKKQFNHVNPWRRHSESAQSVTPWQDTHNGITGNSQLDETQIRRQRAEETKAYGENACRALFHHRPESIVRAWFVESVMPGFRQELKSLVAMRKAYHVVEADEMRKVSGTEHHGGICLLIKKRSAISVTEWCEHAKETACILALDGVSNPHNIGAILRSCAHFGVQGILVEDHSILDSGAATRTAEGGSEYIQAITTETLYQGLTELQKAGYQLIATSSHRGLPLSKITFPSKAILLFGQEQSGLPTHMVEKSDLLVTIAGTGHVESLNVSVAAGILLSEWWRQNHAH